MNSIRCRQCKHFIIANVGEGKIYGCDRSKCVFEPIAKNSPEIDMAIKIIKADSLAPYSVEDILKARDLAVEALKQMKTAKNDLGVEEVTALAEWIEKLTKECEVAYNKGYADGMKAQEPILDKIRAEIMEKIEQEEFARSVFRHEEKDAVKAEQCTGSIMAYNNVIKLIDEYKTEQEK